MTDPATPGNADPTQTQTNAATDAAAEAQRLAQEQAAAAAEAQRVQQEQAAAAAALAAQQPHLNGYVPTVYTADTPPAPRGEIAAELAKTSTLQQKTITADLYTLLQNAQTAPASLMQLNVGRIHTTALVPIPKTAKVRLVYDFSYGTAPLGSQSPIKDTLLALTGDGGALLGHPDAMVLPASSIKLRNCLAAPHDRIQQTLTNAASPVDKYLFKPGNIAAKEDIMGIAPIPAFMAYDALDRDIPAAEMYDRAISMEHNTPVMEHLLNFLRAVMVGDLRKTDKSPAVDLTDWNKALPREAREWKIGQCNALFPTIFAPQHGPVSVPNGPPPLPSTNDKLMEQMLKFMNLQMAKENSSQAGFQEEKKEEHQPADLSTKVSDIETERMLIMCGQDPTSDVSALPKWFGDLFRKNMDKKDKDMIVAQALSARPRFEDYPIKAYPEMKRMIMDRNWVGFEAGMTPCFAYACYGLTPFALQDFTEDEVANMTWDEHALEAANSTSATEYKQAKKKLVASIPEDGQKWKAMILRFTNLLRMLFTMECPLFLKMVEIALLINGYPPEVINKLSHAAKAALTWVVHLQARYFAQGKMYAENPEGEYLPAFTRVFHLLKSGAIHQISIATLPAALQNPPGKRKGDEIEGLRGAHLDSLMRIEKKLKTLEGGKTTDNETGKEKRVDPWNTKLKEKLEAPLTVAAYPTLTQICTYCGLTKEDTLIPNASKRICKSWLVLGKCRYPNCKLLHRTATEEQVTVILKKLDQFVNAPEQCPKGKGDDNN